MYTQTFASSWTQRLMSLLVLVLALGLTACDEDTVDPDPDPTIAELAAQTNSLSTLTTALTEADLVDVLNGAGPFTVFAPTNAAFEALGDGAVPLLVDENNEAVLTKILTYHVVPGIVRADDLSDGQSLETVAGIQLPVAIAGSEVTVGGVPVSQPNVEAANGVVHLIGGVILQHLDIVERAVIAPQLTTLVTALAEAELVTALGAPNGPFTVFTPTDAAFDALPDGTLESLLADEAALTEVLTYHVVSGDVTSGDLSDGGTATTLEGSAVTFAVPATGAPSVNDATIGPADIAVSNGVIHIIDEVLLPPSE